MRLVRSCPGVVGDSAKDVESIGLMHRGSGITNMALTPVCGQPLFRLPPKLTFAVMIHDRSSQSKAYAAVPMKLSITST